jgi:hypothetical protein
MTASIMVARARNASTVRAELVEAVPFSFSGKKDSPSTSSGRTEWVATPAPSVIPALSVIPAKAGIQSDSPPARPAATSRWIPAFAGMTGKAAS